MSITCRDRRIASPICRTVKHVVAASERVHGLGFFEDGLDAQDRSGTFHRPIPTTWHFGSTVLGQHRQSQRRRSYRQPHLLGDGAVRAGRARDHRERRHPFTAQDVFRLWARKSGLFSDPRRRAEHRQSRADCAGRVWEQWLEYEPTVIIGVPTLFADLLRIAEEKIGPERVRQACRRLRFCVSGGEILPAALLLAGSNSPGRNPRRRRHDRNDPYVHRQSAGPVGAGQLRPAWSRAIAPRSWMTATAGHRGEIGNLRVFGPSAAERYWNKPEKTAQVMGRGGVLTGDKLYQDEDGNFFLVGRSDDMLRVGGIWVSPAEVEGGHRTARGGAGMRRRRPSRCA